MGRRIVVLGMLVVTVMCSSSFGYALVYNVRATVKGVDANTEAAIRVPMKGYLVLDFNDANEFQNSALILYGKDANTPRKDKVYVVFDANTTAADISDEAGYSLVSVDPNKYGFNFEALLTGKVKNTDVGPLPGVRPVAKRLKGVIIVWSGMLLGRSTESATTDSQDVAGTANISATLWMAATKFANGNNIAESPEQWTLDEILNGRGAYDGLIATLEEKHYVEAALPEVP